MYQLFKGSQAIVFLFDSVAECYYRAFPGAIDLSKIHIIPNGYDGSLIASSPQNKKTLSVLYTGTLVSYRYDTLLRALALLKNANTRVSEQIRFRFVGEGMEKLTEGIAAYGVSDIVTVSGPTTHAEIARLEREAHALLVLGRLATIKGHELFAGAKLFNYLKANRPIFGVLPDDETRKVLHRVGVSAIADVDSPADIASKLKKLIDAYSSKDLAPFLPDEAKCEFYSAEYQTQSLILALEGSNARDPFISRVDNIPLSLQELLTG
jgi:glycosyltransferase involved in cell wall biosynthesis